MTTSAASDLSRTDIYYYAEQGAVVFQGATQQAIEFLKSRYVLLWGTTAMIPEDKAEEAFEAVDAAGLHTRGL